MARRIAIALVAVAALSACAGGQDPAVFRLRPGDCFDDPPPGRQLGQADVVACDQPHDNEVFAAVRHPADPDAAFPGREAVIAHAQQACPAPFADYVGTAYDQSRYSLVPIVPTAETWARGDRQIICALYDHEAGKLTGSVRGSGT